MRDGETAVAHADRGGDPFQRISAARPTPTPCIKRAERPKPKTLRRGRGDAGGVAAQFPLLYSLQGFRFCDFLLADAERAVWGRLVRETGRSGTAIGGNRDLASTASPHTERFLKRMAQLTWSAAKSTLHGSTPQNWLLDFGLDHLSLARAALYAGHSARRNARRRPLARRGGLPAPRRASKTTCPAASSAAPFSAPSPATSPARARISTRPQRSPSGGRCGSLADIHLHRARLFGLMASRPADYPWVSPREDLDAAKKLVNNAATAVVARNSPTPRRPMRGSAAGPHNRRRTAFINLCLYSRNSDLSTNALDKKRNPRYYPRRVRTEFASSIPM